MTDPPAPYSEATVELVADAVAEATLAPSIGGTRRHARLILDALYKAGLLVPESDRRAAQRHPR